MSSTLQLVTAATILAIVLGITVGIISALRQYSAVDYSFTFASFFLYSLPSFLMGVILKVFVALGFNNWLRDPVFTWAWIIRPLADRRHILASRHRRPSATAASSSSRHPCSSRVSCCTA